MFNWLFWFVIKSLFLFSKSLSSKSSNPGSIVSSLCSTSGSILFSSVLKANKSIGSSSIVCCSSFCSTGVTSLISVSWGSGFFLGLPLPLFGFASCISCSGVFSFLGLPLPLFGSTIFMFSISSSSCTICELLFSLDNKDSEFCSIGGSGCTTGSIGIIGVWVVITCSCTGFCGFIVSGCVFGTLLYTFSTFWRFTLEGITTGFVNLLFCSCWLIKPILLAPADVPPIFLAVYLFCCANCTSLTLSLTLPIITCWYFGDFSSNTALTFNGNFAAIIFNCVCVYCEAISSKLETYCSSFPAIFL